MWSDPGVLMISCGTPCGPGFSSPDWCLLIAWWPTSVFIVMEPGSCSEFIVQASVFEVFSLWVCRTLCTLKWESHTKLERKVEHVKALSCSEEAIYENDLWTFLLVIRAQFKPYISYGMGVQKWLRKGLLCCHVRAETGQNTSLSIFFNHFLISEALCADHMTNMRKLKC